MSPENDKKLMEKFPKLFVPRGHWGPAYPECGDGWFDILNTLCTCINHHASKKGLTVYIAQIKEKFGGLRFYVDGADETVHMLISFAEGISFSTCEVCGDKGKERREGWIKVLCDKHHEENVKQREEFNRKIKATSP